MMRAKDSLKASMVLLELSLQVPQPHANAFDASATITNEDIPVNELPRMARSTFEQLIAPWPPLTVSSQTAKLNKTLPMSPLPTPLPFLSRATDTKLRKYIPVFVPTVADIKGTSSDLLERTKRGAFLFIVSAFSLVASVLTLNGLFRHRYHGAEHL